MKRIINMGTLGMALVFGLFFAGCVSEPEAAEDTWDYSATAANASILDGTWEADVENFKHTFVINKDGTGTYIYQQLNPKANPGKFDIKLSQDSITVLMHVNTNVDGKTATGTIEVPHPYTIVNGNLVLTKLGNINNVVFSKIQNPLLGTWRGKLNGGYVYEFIFDGKGAYWKFNDPENTISMVAQPLNYDDSTITLTLGGKPNKSSLKYKFDENKNQFMVTGFPDNETVIFIKQ
jgi:hypothetical protein